MPHIKALDGVRAVAVLAVVFFHLGLFPVGWIGVQTFFVLSGYLITGILLTAKSANFSVYLRRFYWRRSLRIFPLYFTYLGMAALIFAGPFMLDWPWLVTYTANFARLREADLSAPFTHLWSLAVEEQFYLVWPVVVFFLNTGSLRKLVIAVLCLAPLSRLVVYCVFYDSSQDWLGRTIYGLPTSQSDAFAAGAMLVLFEVKHATRWFWILAGLTLVCGAVVLTHQHLAYHSALKWSFGYAMFLLKDAGFVWAYSLLNIASAFGIAWAIERSPALFTAFPMRRIGIVSYGIYVYHLPLLILSGTFAAALGIFMVPIYLLITYVIAEISYRYLETPFLCLKDRASGSFVPEQL
jgi:peptidoglycan/LPS O-acetylase OafA/YrhL